MPSCSPPALVRVLLTLLGLKSCPISLSLPWSPLVSQPVRVSLPSEALHLPVPPQEGCSELISVPSSSSLPFDEEVPHVSFHMVPAPHLSSFLHAHGFIHSLWLTAPSNITFPSHLVPQPENTVGLTHSKQIFTWTQVASLGIIIPLFPSNKVRYSFFQHFLLPILSFKPQLHDFNCPP